MSSELVGNGPLQGLRVVEIGGIGPGPFCGMLLADLGADVVVVDRVDVDTNSPRERDPMRRGKRSISADLKDPTDLESVMRIIDSADGAFEGFRPGVAERLGIGPEHCQSRNPRLVYGRMTGWGQSGPYAKRAGHDINYMAISGTLSMIGRAGDRPLPPANLLGDFGGGGMLLAVGMLSGMIEAARTGKGKVVDASILDGGALIATWIYGMRSQGRWHDERGINFVDTGAPFYEVYRCADDRFVAVGAIERGFYAHLLEGLGLDAMRLPEQWDEDAWPYMKELFAERFSQRSRAEWVESFAGLEACVSPVLNPDEVLNDPHNAERGVLVERDGVLQPAPAPRFLGR